MEEYWLSCKKFTVWVAVKNGFVKDTAPIVKRFRNQTFFSLKRWAGKFGGLEVQKLNAE